MKRLLDITAAGIGLLILAPLLIGIGLAVVLESKGGMFYLQERIGFCGKPFQLFKFRSMYPDADKRGLLTVGDRDPRITRVGYILRKYKLDELPQLFNVLKGDMSLVGPRPEVRKYVDLYSEEQRKVLLAKPGITDLASLEYFKEAELLAQAQDPHQLYIDEIMPAKLQLNLQYIEQQTIQTDLKIIARTILKIITTLATPNRRAKPH